jgi:hypothetical protein
VLDVVDGRDKFVDFPAFLGGSDVQATNLVVAREGDDSELISK